MRKIFLHAILLCFICSNLMAQTITIEGTVTEAATGESLPGVNVIIKGTLTGTVTDLNGHYSIITSPTATLSFSFIGMQTTEIPVNGRTRIDVVLAADAQEIEEVVITAMSIPRVKKSLGYASQEVKADALDAARQTDLNNALVGKVAGVRFWGASGATYDAGKVVLRGTNNLSAEGSSPIYVVNGVITDVNSINLDDIESVNVLKGPAATALYGSRGGEGAIIITTKKARQGRATIDFGQTFAIERAVVHSDFQNEYGGGSLGGDADLLAFNYNPSIHPAYLQPLNGARYYDMWEDESWGPRLDGRVYVPFYAWDPSHPKFGQTATWSPQPENNLKELYRTGWISTTNIALAKAAEDFNIRASFSNVARQGVVENSDATRRYLSLNAGYTIAKRLRINADYNYTYRRTLNPVVEDYPSLGSVTGTYTQYFHRNVNIDDLRDYQRSDQTFRTWNPTSLTDLTPRYQDNPFALFNEIAREQTDNWHVFSANLTLDIIKGKLAIGGNFNGDLNNMKYEQKVPNNILDQNNLGSYSIQTRDGFDYQIQGFISYNDRFLNDRLDIGLRLYTELHDNQYDGWDEHTRNGLTENYDFTLAASVSSPYSEPINWHVQDRSIFGTGTIGWDNTYYLDFSARQDWSSTLPEDNNGYFYGGVSLSAIVSNYLRNVKWLSFWKLRASLAQVGSTMGPYQTREYLKRGNRHGGVETFFQSNNMISRGIKPTISNSWEVGTEFRLFNNRLWGDFNFYTKDSKSQILDINVTPASGYDTRKINAGLIRNQGYEISLGGSPIRTKDMEWAIYANWSYNENMIIKLNPENPDAPYRVAWFSFSDIPSVYLFNEPDKPVGVIKGSAIATDANGNLIIDNITGLPKLDGNKMKELGNVQPDATGGFGTSFTWKGLKLAVGFDYQIGGNIVSLTNMNGEFSGMLKSTIGKNDKGVDVRTSPNNGGGVKVTGVTETGTVYSDYADARNYYQSKANIWEPYVYDASYLKMREISLSYTFPSQLLERWNIGLSQARVSLIAQNPWLLYSGIPNVDASEIGNAFNGFIEQGQSFSTRTLGISINVTF